MKTTEPESCVNATALHYLRTLSLHVGAMQEVSARLAFPRGHPPHRTRAPARCSSYMLVLCVCLSCCSPVQRQQVNPTQNHKV